MKYTEDIQMTIDIDWFAVDLDGVIVHFASGGGKIPNSVAFNQSDTKKITQYFRDLPVKASDFKVSQTLDHIIKFPSRESQERYLNDFIEMANRGLYSFDKTEPGNFSNKQYHLVVSPESTLKLDSLPEDIQAILKRTKIPQRVSKIDRLLVNEVL